MDRLDMESKNIVSSNVDISKKLKATIIALVSYLFSTICLWCIPQYPPKANGIKYNNSECGI